MVDTAVEAMEEAGTAEEATVAVAAMVTETAGAMEVAATEVMAVAVDTVEEDIVAVEVVVTGATVVDTASMEGILEGAGMTTVVEVVVTHPETGEPIPRKGPAQEALCDEVGLPGDASHWTFFVEYYKI